MQHLKIRMVLSFLCCFPLSVQDASGRPLDASGKPFNTTADIAAALAAAQRKMMMLLSN